MHPLQRDFLTAIESDDPTHMEAALSRIVETYCGTPLRQGTKEEIFWVCREIRESFSYRHGFGQIFPMPEAVPTNEPVPYLVFLFLNTGLREEDSGSVEIRIGATSPLHQQERWTALGFSTEKLPLVYPKRRKPYVPGSPSIHRPPVPHPIAPEDRYGHAREFAAQFGPGPLFARYLAGEHEQVWDELLALGENARSDAALLADATHVAQETMRRCRSNVVRLQRRLETIRYQFGVIDTGEEEPEVDTSTPPYQPPSENVLQRIVALESQVGALPLSFCAWMEMVGSVDWCGSHWSLCALMDPLVFDPEERLLKYSEDRWRRGKYLFDFAPDVYMKDYVSGDRYCIFLPHAGLDALIEGTPYAEDGSEMISFIRYLRHCFRWGGFPSQKRLTAPLDDPKDTRMRLAQGLLPI